MRTNKYQPVYNNSENNYYPNPLTSSNGPRKHYPNAQWDDEKRTPSKAVKESRKKAEDLERKAAKDEKKRMKQDLEQVARMVKEEKRQKRVREEPQVAAKCPFKKAVAKVEDAKFWKHEDREKKKRTGVEVKRIEAVRKAEEKQRREREAVDNLESQIEKEFERQRRKEAFKREDKEGRERARAMQKGWWAKTWFWVKY